MRFTSEGALRHKIVQEEIRKEKEAFDALPEHKKEEWRQRQEEVRQEWVQRIDSWQLDESIERANAMANAWRGGRSNLYPGQFSRRMQDPQTKARGRETVDGTEEFEKQHQMAMEDDPRALVPAHERPALEKRMMQQRFEQRPPDKKIIYDLIKTIALNFPMRPEQVDLCKSQLRVWQQALRVGETIRGLSIPQPVKTFLCRGSAKVLEKDPNLFARMDDKSLQRMLYGQTLKHVAADVP